MEPSPAHRAARDRIAAELAAAGFALPGTLTVRSYACGKPGCRCHADPPRLHGPYAEWTRKIGGKTITRRLTPAELAAIASSGMVLPGSITERRTRCGRPNCGCHADPPRLHGPYWQWTRKVAAKTTCRWLSADQHHDYRPWIGNDRRLHELLARLETLGTAALEADPRWNR